MIRRVPHAAPALILLVAAALSAAAGGASAAEEGSPARLPRGDRLTGVVLPIEALEGDISIRGLRARSWSVEDTQRLLIEQDVRIDIAGHRFRADAAVIWINRLHTEAGPVNQIAVYFDRLVNPAQAVGAGVTGREILVTGAARGRVVLDVGHLDDRRPPRPPGSLLRRAENRLAQHLYVLREREPDPRPPRHPTVHIPPVVDPDDPAAVPPEPAPDPDPARWLSAPAGMLSFSAEQVSIERGEEENVITLIGPLILEYVAGDPGERWQRITLTAARGVIFADPGPLEEMFRGRLMSEQIRGVYLEGNVIARADVDEYMIRAPKVYYDFRTDQAIMVDAVLRTYSRGMEEVVYTRAAELRQVAERQWTARQVRVSTSEFFTPHFAIGARRVTVTQRPERTAVAEDAAPRETHLAADHITLRAGGVPLFYLPRFSGTLRETPLRSIGLDTRRNDGLRILTEWNLFTLLGAEQPAGLDAALKVDGFTKRGAATGVEFTYDVPEGAGLLDLYGMYDTGIDRTSAGRDVDPERDWRGVALWEHHSRLDRHWMLQGQAAWISDPSFISAWRDDDFRRRREFETSAYLKGQQENTAFTVLATHDLNDFVANESLLASRQFQVERLPEITYRRYGDSLLDWLTYSTETRLSRVRISPHEHSAAETGVPAAAFGLGLNDPVDEFLAAEGFPARFVNRLDTRHEIAMPGSWGAFRITPFLTGRVTLYDSEFDDFSDDADDLRLFGAAGVRLSTQLQHIDDTVESRLLDLHRLRHIVEPRLLLWYGYSTVERGALPEFDPAVEGVGDGALMEVGMRNVWQTQRGGPERWRSVDLFTLDTSLVLHTDTGSREQVSPVPQLFDYRPEYSPFGDHVRASAVWLVSDFLSLAGEGIYDLEEHVLARSSIGAELRHSPLLSTYIEYRRIDASDHEMLDVGWDYRLTPKYRILLRPSWDFREEQLRSINVRLTRAFPDFNLIMFVRFDRIRDETQVGATLDLVRF